MKEFTRDNHLKISSCLFKAGETDYPYTITEIGEPENSIKSGLEIATDVACEIYEKSNSRLPINLFLSGGLDSECMLIAFIKSGVPFEVVGVKFKDDLNRHDMADLADLCRRHRVIPKILDFDIIQFYESGRHFRLAEKFLCRSPQFTAHFEFFQMVNGTSLMAWQPLKIQTSENEKSLILPDDSAFSYCRFIEGSGLCASPFFFLYTPELIASFLRHEFLNAFTQKFEGKSSYGFKVYQYQLAGFEVAARLDKFTGFELVKEYYRSKYPSQIDPFNQMYRIPLELKYPIPYPVCRHSKIFLEGL